MYTQPAYPNTNTPRQKHTGTRICVILGTLVGVGAGGVVALLDFLAYAYNSISNHPDPTTAVITYGVGGVLIIVALAMIAMWGLFIVRRYKAALYTSFVPMGFAVIAFIVWEFLTYGR